MKRLFISLLLALVCSASFAAQADTTAIRQSDVTKWICDTTTTAKGKQVVKYYALYKGQLVSTNRTTLQNVSLCEKYKAQCALVLITTKTGRKRIICN